jgi:methyl-galactoside transport system ATP-binding protein
MSEYILEMKNVNKSFPGVKALDNVMLNLRPGTVHALMGENGAGKSTLMKCLFGVYSMDGGEVIYRGEPVKITNPNEALLKGIAMVHQELNPIPDRSIAENIFCGRYPMKVPGILVDQAKMNAETREVLKHVNMDFDPTRKMGTLSVSQMQLVEIARAVSVGAKIVIMDEPTSSLTRGEVSKLFSVIDRLKAEGVAIIYISHKMDEILRISDEVTILRDGQYIGTWPASELTTDLIITRMVGRQLSNLFPKRENVPGETVLQIEDYTSIHPKSFRGVNFSLRKGEILGVSGLVGAQRTELMEGIFAG